MEDRNILVQIRNLQRLIPVNKRGQDGTKAVVHAVDGVDLDIYENETLALVGESGCGKSTLGKTVLNLVPATGGEVLYDGVNILELDEKSMRDMRRNMQIVFQDIGASLNSRQTVEQILRTPIMNYHRGLKTEEVRQRVHDLLELVGLSPADAYMLRYPHEFSGGQRQRIGIARAIAVSPRFIVADEPVSALDVSIRGQILNLFLELKHKLNISYLFITHDMSVVRSIADRVAVMYLGKIVELADADEFFNNTAHPYSKAILSATPVADPEAARSRSVVDLKGELPSPINVPKGCRFNTRCQYAQDRCRESVPELADIGGGHLCACFRRQDGEI